MKKKIIKMKFHSPLHVGNRNLTDSEFTIKADTIFSALCLESENIEALVAQVKNKKLRISDALPYIDSYYYIPKPIMHIKHESENYKLFKKIKYIPYDMLDQYLEGCMYPEDELENFLLGESDLRSQVSVGKDPFNVGIYNFHKNSGLYIIVEYEDDYILDLFQKLQYSGIGGKRSSGMGRFSFELDECFDLGDGGHKILLNTAMAKDGEIESVLEGAGYLLQKRSGFINQSRYKKRDFYTFTAGSVFTKKFEGDVFDVGNGEYPVYRYEVPMFLGVNL